MSDSNPLAAQLLETSAAGYASAAHTLLRESPNIGPGFSQDSAEWKLHIRQRILELASAIRVDQPNMFVRRINWLRAAIRARGADESSMRAALESLRVALDREFPEQFKPAVEQPIRLALDMLEQDFEPEAEALDGSTDTGRLGLEYLESCLEARADKAIAIVMDAIGSQLSPQQAYTQVLLPAQRETGRLWHKGDISIAEERLVSEATRELMTLIVNRHARKADFDRSLIAASVAGNAHDIGLRAVSDLFRLAGWRSMFLGADMPGKGIAQAIQTFEPKLVVLSATMTTQLNALAETIEHIRKIDNAPPVIVGGLALEDSADLWQQLGADAYAPDAEAAVEIGSKFVS